MIDFAAAEALARGRPIGSMPELKHSTYFRSIGMPLEDRFLATLAAHEYLRRCPLVIQSFETANLRYLRQKLGRRGGLRLMQLTSGTPEGLRPFDIVKNGGTLTYREMMSPTGLAEIARYADILAPDTRSVLPLGPDGRLGVPSPMTTHAHRAGLQVIPYTFRPENYFLAADFRSPGAPAARSVLGSVAEIGQYLETSIDGFFTDDPGLGRWALGMM